MQRFLRPFLAFTAALSLCVEARAQWGCTDAQANNFNPTAIVNDGSCIYPTTYYTSIYEAKLPSRLNEISGLQQADGKWWAIADSGNGATFYQIKMSNGNIIQEIDLKNGENDDWEDIAADSQYLYIGDFGNNANARTNLGIYRIPLDKTGNDNEEQIDDDEYSFIPFRYADQTDFTPVDSDSATFDCEAMIRHQGRFYLFGKNRLHRISTLYAIDETTGLAIAQDTLNTGGLITGADVSADGKRIVLMGYELEGIPKVFLWLLWDWPGNQFFQGHKRRIELGSALIQGQAESIAFETAHTGFIGNEKTSLNDIIFVDASLWRFDLTPWFMTSDTNSEPASDDFPAVLNPFGDRLVFPKEKPESIVLCNLLGQKVLEVEQTGGIDAVHTAGLSPGVYYLMIPGHSGRLMVKH